MIVNDLQRLRWQIIDQALRSTDVEYYMGDKGDSEPLGVTRSLYKHVNEEVKKVNRAYKCSKRVLQNDLDLFKKKGARLEPRFRRGHRRILRYMNLEWKNPLLRGAQPVEVLINRQQTATEGPTIFLTLRILKDEDIVMSHFPQAKITQRQCDSQGTVILQMDVPKPPRLVPLLLSLSPEVEVLTPLTLREDIREAIADLRKIYEKEKTPTHATKAVQTDLFGELF